MGLKHECPAPAKFGSADPLWKTATICFLKTVRIAVTSMPRLETCKRLSPHACHSVLPLTLAFFAVSDGLTFVIWERIIDGFTAALRASTCVLFASQTPSLPCHADTACLLQTRDGSSNIRGLT